jgi:hypothetical protein
MNKVLLILSLVLLASCGPSQQEKKIAAVTCSIMSETRNMDGAVRVEKINEARDKIGGEPFLDGDAGIIEAFEWDLCQELVLNEAYDESLQSLKDTERERERIAAENQRIAAETRAEEKRVIAEKQRIADSTPTVKEEFHSNGNLSRRTNYQSKTEGGKREGLDERYYENGQLEYKGNYKDGEWDGLFERYSDGGELAFAACYDNGSEVDMSNCQ